ncbi:MAG TPA: zf-HC2 domain-containing protein [Pyrinomonadaceae bacterium]|nr:zf-HC2 domain-containing protein [Pyrinomonadaceae bacterium]
MNGNCLDIGTIQAFLDGETHPEEAVRISDHVADCDACTLMLAQAEEESSMVFSVLDREINTLVPTQRLWTRINDSIAEEKSRTPVWQRLAAFVSASFMNPSFAGAAGILMVVGLAAVVWNLNSGGSNTSDTNIVSVPASSKPIVPESDSTIVGPQVAAAKDSGKDGVRFTTTKLPDNEVKKLINANYIERGPKKVEPVAARYLPGEESYIRTINDLEQSVSVQNASLSASSQVSYAKDIAVVDDSISKMREVVKKNPRNQAARQVLYSTYQDKIDLLKASSGRGEMMASLQ